MTPRLLAQLGSVARLDAEALEDSYAWPRKQLTDAEANDAAHLHAIADACFTSAAASGFEGHPFVEEATS